MHGLTLSVVTLCLLVFSHRLSAAWMSWKSCESHGVDPTLQWAILHGSAAAAVLCRSGRKGVRPGVSKCLWCLCMPRTLACTGAATGSVVCACVLVARWGATKCENSLSVLVCLVCLLAVLQLHIMPLMRPVRKLRPAGHSGDQVAPGLPRPGRQLLVRVHAVTK